MNCLLAAESPPTLCSSALYYSHNSTSPGKQKIATFRGAHSIEIWRYSFIHSVSQWDRHWRRRTAACVCVCLRICWCSSTTELYRTAVPRKQSQRQFLEHISWCDKHRIRLTYFHLPFHLLLLQLLLFHCLVDQQLHFFLLFCSTISIATDCPGRSAREAEGK